MARSHIAAMPIHYRAGGCDTLLYRLLMRADEKHCADGLAGRCDPRDRWPQKNVSPPRICSRLLK